MSEMCVFCDGSIADNEARFVSIRSTVAHPNCLIEGYPDAEGSRWHFERAAGAALASGENVRVAVIVHEDGVVVFVATTRTGLHDKIYAYVDELWSEFHGDDPMPSDHGEAIDAYFEDNDAERLTIETASI